MIESHSKRHWTINGRFLAARSVTGVQRYAREIVTAMDRLIEEGRAPELIITLIAPPQVAEMLPLTSIRCRQAGPFTGHLWEQAELPFLAQGGLLSLCNTGPVLHRRQIVCFHDLNTSTRPESYSFAFRSAYNIARPALARTAALITTVSHYSAGEIANSGLAPLDKIRVIPNGHEHTLRWKSSHAERLGKMDTIVLIGSVAPHKNLGVVLGLAPSLERHGLRIAVVGSFDQKVFSARADVIDAPNVDFCGPLSDAEMARLLEGALCLAFPSLAEGFGLPPLEAMALGCPVVASGTTSLPEVCGEAVLYAAPNKPQEWLESFLRLKLDADVRRELIKRGREQRLLYSWRRSAELYLEAMTST